VGEPWLEQCVRVNEREEERERERALEIARNRGRMM